ncbi:MAG: ABC transporter substrate-binding protein [Moorea sp. SIO3I8]|nr:ABC transporter substrate-binding protein [Moorena sp. SIO3I8]
MKQILSRCLILLSLILFLTGCSRSIASDISTVTLSGWQSSPKEKQLLEQVLREFEASHPGRKVKFEVITDQYMDVIKTRLIGDAAPDVFYVDALDAPLLMTHGVLEPLDDYITEDQDLDLDDLAPHLSEAFQSDGKTYGLPKDFTTLALFYNQKYFDQLSISNPPQTWEELEDYAKKLTRDTTHNGRVDIYGLGITPELSRHYFMIKAFGGELVDQKGEAVFATRQSLSGLTPLMDMYRENHSAAIPSDVGASSGSEMFGQGKAAMVIEGSYAIPYLQQTFPKIEFATAEVPSIGNHKGSMVYTVAYVMNKQAKNKEAAWELISYLTGKEGMKAWANGGLAIPARKSVISELGYEQNPLYTPFIAGADYATIWQEDEKLPIFMTHFDNQFLSALLGEQSLKSAMKKAQQTANKEIQASNY